MVAVVEAHQGGIDRRTALKTLGGLALIAAGVSQPPNAQACIGDKAENAFYELIIKPVISNPEILNASPDGGAYARLDVSKGILRDVINNPLNYVPKTDRPKEGRLYETLEEALKARPNKPYTYIIRFDKRGVVTNIYDGYGSQLKLSKATLRGIGNCRPMYNF